jgi:CDP-diacylglycerol--glycerol-3-phosphate 3-phosphatidyltransferase
MLPNLISLSRLVLAAAFVHYAQHPVIAVTILCVAGISDWLDGFAAKKLGQQTPLGVVLDPLCDRVFVVTALVTLVVVHDVPLWQLALLLARDIVNSLGVAILGIVRRDRFGKLHPRLSGKVVTSLQFWCVVHILLGLPLFEISLAAVVLATVWAAVDYSAEFRALMGDSKSVNTP